MKTTLILVLLGIVALLGLGAFAHSQGIITINALNGTVLEGAAATTTETGGKGGEVEMTTVRVPVFAEGGDIVCGMRMVFVERAVPQTQAVLSSAYAELFKMSEPYLDGDVQYQNPIGYQAVKTEFPRLTFERVAIVNGVASVYLNGSITGVGTCYDPLPKIQLDATAKQFPTVTSVRYYLNGKESDPACIADMKGDKPCYTGAGEQ